MTWGHAIFVTFAIDTLKKIFHIFRVMKMGRPARIISLLSLKLYGIVSCCEEVQHYATNKAKF